MNQGMNHGRNQLLSRGKGSILSSESSIAHQRCNINSGDNSQNDGCLAGCIGGGGVGQDGIGLARNDVVTTAAAAAATNDDPTLLVAEELQKLSLKEREIVYEEIHGVSMVEDESNQELVNKRLKEMKVELENIPSSKKVAYLMAMEEYGETGKDFCQDETLHLMFLRADRWDSKKAATRFVGWMDWKLQLFGRELLCHRHITLDKLDEQSRQAFHYGMSQMLPQRDTSGRTVMFDNLGNHTKHSLSGKNMLELFWYILMATIEDDIQTQRMGIVYILYAVDGKLSFTTDDLKYIYAASRMLPMLPVRINCVHYCSNDPNMAPIISMIQKAIGSHVRARFRAHKGNHTEVHYSLMTYGVPVNVLPLTPRGRIQKDYHLKWYKRREARDSKMSNLVGGGRHNDFYGIDLPSRCDILLGKSKLVQNHFGNRRLQECVSLHMEEYDSAIYGDRQVIAEKILLRLVPDPGCGDGQNSVRFLKQRKDGWWEQVTHQESIEKICHSFRAFRRTTNAMKSSDIARTPGSDEISNLTSQSTGTERNDGPSAASTKRVKVDSQNSS